MSEINAYWCECYENMKYTPSTPNFAQVKFTPSLSSLSGPLYLHSFFGFSSISPKFSPLRKPWSPRPWQSFTGRSPALPVSNCTGETQGSFFLSISFSFWCWLYPKRQRGNERDRSRKATKSFHSWRKNLWSSVWIWCWESVKGISAHLAIGC